MTIPTNRARRSLMKRSLRLAVVSIPVTMVLGRRAAFADDQTKTSLQYQDHQNGNLRCAQFVFFVPSEPGGAAGVCRVIDGDGYRQRLVSNL